MRPGIHTGDKQDRHVFPGVFPAVLSSWATSILCASKHFERSPKWPYAMAPIIAPLGHAYPPVCSSCQDMLWIHLETVDLLKNVGWKFEPWWVSRYAPLHLC